MCVCACDVVKLQKHGGCVPGMELENVPVPLSLASEEEPPALTPAPAPLSACLPPPAAQPQLPPQAMGVSCLFWGGGGGVEEEEEEEDDEEEEGGQEMRKAGICEEEN